MYCTGRGSSPFSRHRELFFRFFSAGRTFAVKAFFQRSTASVVPHCRQRTSTNVRVISRWTCLLHCNNCANQYKSQCSRMRNAYPRPATLANFVFALIGLYISCAPRPIETYFLTIIHIQLQFLHTAPLPSCAPPVISSPNALSLNGISGRCLIGIFVAEFYLYPLQR